MKLQQKQNIYKGKPYNFLKSGNCCNVLNEFVRFYRICFTKTIQFQMNDETFVGFFLAKICMVFNKNSNLD